MFMIKTKLFFTHLLLATLMLSGCTTYDAYTGEAKTSNAVKYGAIGAAVCAIIGATKSGKYARNAALGCGVVGAGIGAYMDAQEKKLRRSLENTGVRVSREGDHIRLVMPGNITFATDKSELQESFEPVLNSVVTVLREYDKTIVEVHGFTDSTGSYGYNMSLSENRARQVSNYLETGGIIGQRLLVVGKGPTAPIATNETAAGRSLNRRVEIRLRAIEKG